MSYFQVVYDVAPRWNMLKVINLEVNHRQGGDKMYADLLNRVRTGSQTKEDIKQLQKRVYKKGHEIYKEVEIYIVCTRKTSKNINLEYLNKEEGHEIILKASHSHALQGNYKPKIDDVGEVGKTGFTDELKLKIGSKVMLIQNIDVADCLTNGQLGTLVGTTKAQNECVKMLIVDFKNKNVGKTWRKEHPAQAAKYPGGTGIERVSLSYSLTEKSQKNITVIQYPLKLAYAVTSHKIQGQGIPKPLLAAMDLKTTFTASQAYVMLSRVEDIKQVVIMDRFTENNIKIDQKALRELENMNRRSVNKNPTPWRDDTKQAIKIAALNIMNLKNNFKYVAEDPTLGMADIICLSETWLKDEDDDESFQIEDYEAKFNSIGPGKGIASFYKPNIFSHKEDCKLTGGQISKFESDEVDVIHIYRSQEQRIETIIEGIRPMINESKVTVVCGDINICLLKTPNNKITQYLTSLGLKQLNKEASHIAGGHIDHMYLSQDATTRATMERYSPFYSDHDALCLNIQEGDPQVRDELSFLILY